MCVDKYCFFALFIPYSQSDYKYNAKVIANFNILNFGSIKNKQTLSFEADKSKHLEDFYIHKIKNARLLKIALIYGANASGKTTILKAIDFLRGLVLEPVRDKTESLDFEPFLFDPNTPEENSILSIDFFHNETRYFYKVEFNKKAIVKEELKFAKVKKALVFTRTTDIKYQTTKIKFGRKIKIDKTTHKVLEANTLWNNTVLGGYLKTNVETEELKNVIQWFKDYLKPVIYPRTKLNEKITKLIKENAVPKNVILTILKKADFHISDIKIREEDILKIFINLLESQGIPMETFLQGSKKERIPSLRWDFEHSVNNQNYLLPFRLESAGTQRYYGLAGILALLLSSPKIFPIDELEASLHPDLYQHFLLTFLANAKDSQIIATTHNREILNNKDLIRDDALWITEKSKDAATELYSFADFDSSVIRDTTNRLNAYKSGKLGGIPNVGDYYL